MRIITTKNYDEMSRKAANIIASQISLKPDSVLGLATGSSPIGLYKKLIEWCKEGKLDFSKVRSVNLDEYVGLSKTHDQSYNYFMKENLFDQINILPSNTYLPDGENKDAEKECSRYDMLIESMGGIDLQLLGIGHNGHIAFNEPADSFSKGTNCVDLQESTIKANARFFPSENDVPKKAYTMGVGSIMKAKTILLIVSGKEKAQILKDSLYGAVTPNVPASILQFHKNLIVVCDEEAGKLL